ncbi:glycosyltransferase family 2 protein [Dendronalium sp. ChiSLP03b]|uniref:glycosyltransferase family 2 protein n=1 Tax=Dendronalium sp. ChiSLP03b TaxID=3075381 RepID=UPI002AD59C9B|nr:glycosyltransferase family 2 protein [Dendronalium sp. ChiSLP03b]MDZ8206068.1 glycosyltransferase family 2 protein [Dendronalium sp. ChiSLP03b]
MKQPQLAVIMTCFNRRETTLNCLHSLYQQTKSFDVYLTDDGSSDGTSKAVKVFYPQVQILQGNGNLFWVGGMRLAFAEAMQKDYDYYLWLNDDTILESNTLERLLTIHQKLLESGRENSILVGTTQDLITREASYGGAMKSRKWYSNKYEFLGSTEVIQECDTMFGNCVLVPRAVVKKVGNLDAAFIHSLGDLDYGLRARKNGCSIWVVPGYVGTCSKNSIRNSWVDTKLSVLERLKKVIQVKAFPLKPWTAFCRRHSGLFWVIYWFLPYLRAIIGYKNLAASPTFAEKIPQSSSQP